jgi:hypothetical protein
MKNNMGSIKENYFRIKLYLAAWLITGCGMREGFARLNEFRGKFSQFLGKFSEFLEKLPKFEGGGPPPVDIEMEVW